MDTSLTNEERGLLIMLLQKEEKNLLIEISHCILHESRQSLKDKLHIVRTLLEKYMIPDPVGP